MLFLPRSGPKKKIFFEPITTSRRLLGVTLSSLSIRLIEFIVKTHSHSHVTLLHKCHICLLLTFRQAHPRCGNRGRYTSSRGGKTGTPVWRTRSRTPRQRHRLGSSSRRNSRGPYRVESRRLPGMEETADKKGNQ